MSVWSYDIKSHKARQLEVPLDADGYIPRIKATADASRVLVYTLNRHQDELNIFGVNPRSTVSTLLIKDKADKYIKEELQLAGKKRMGAKDFLNGNKDIEDFSVVTADGSDTKHDKQ